MAPASVGQGRGIGQFCYDAPEEAATCSQTAERNGCSCDASRPGGHQRVQRLRKRKGGPPSLWGSWNGQLWKETVSMRIAGVTRRTGGCSRWIRWGKRNEASTTSSSAPLAWTIARCGVCGRRRDTTPASAPRPQDLDKRNASVEEYGVRGGAGRSCCVPVARGDVELHLSADRCLPVSAADR